MRGDKKSEGGRDPLRAARRVPGAASRAPSRPTHSWRAVIGPVLRSLLMRHVPSGDDGAGRLRMPDPNAVARPSSPGARRSPTRNAFQRDRDRIVHSAPAFRRLVYKTQVFLNHEGDLFRTRLTHSLEVAQIWAARSPGHSQLNEDLVEAIALAHDLGHTPFGHAGQDALNECLHQEDRMPRSFRTQPAKPARGRRCSKHRYPQYDGLNLSFETREGVLKHCSRANARAARGGRARTAWRRRFIDRLQPVGARSTAVQPRRRDRLQRPRHRRRRALGAA